MWKDFKISFQLFVYSLRWADWDDSWFLLEIMENYEVPLK